MPDWSLWLTVGGCVAIVFIAILFKLLKRGEDMKLKTVGLILLVAGIVGASIGVVFSVFSTGYLTVEVR